jgi:hypothetical protein
MPLRAPSLREARRVGEEFHILGEIFYSAQDHTIGRDCLGKERLVMTGE